MNLVIFRGLGGDILEVMQTILYVCGVISIVGGTGTVIYKVIHPAIYLTQRVEDLEEKSRKDYQNMQMLAEMQKAQSKCLLALLNHQITGNGIENMKKIRDEMTENILMH